jgi:hypothetical protein
MSYSRSACWIRVSLLSFKPDLCNASLREDYLNQVQRDFLSRNIVFKQYSNTPSELSFLVE